MSGLEARLRSERPVLTVDFEIEAGHTLAMLGPNGAGKSTALNILAGLRRTPDSRVVYNGTVLQDGKQFIPAHRRPVVLLTQQTRLFPHLSVRRNVAYGPAAAGLSRREAGLRADEWLARVGVADLAAEPPARLSGGQAQRVAIARALAADPAVLLLDEPFAAADVSVTQELRNLLRELLSDRTGVTVLVTHDPIDALTLAGRALVLEAGRVAESGPTRELLVRPATRFTATLGGMNLVTGVYDGQAVVDPAGNRVVGTGGAPPAGTAAAAAFSPRAVAVFGRRPEGSPRTVLAATVADVGARGDAAVVGVDVGDIRISAELTWAAVADLNIVAGQQVWLAVKATEVAVYPLP